MLCYRSVRGPVAALAVTVLGLYLLYVCLLPPPPDPEEPLYSHRIRWNRDKASTEMWQVTSLRPNDEGAISRMTSRHRVAGFQRAHAEICPRYGAGVLLLFIVTSAPGNRAERQAVRLTWTSLTRSAEFAFAFILGQPPSNMRADLAAEDDMYGDLVIANFVDSYANLTLKSLSMLEWSHSYCPRAAFLFKTDDDVFINVPLLHRFVKQRVNQSLSMWGRMVKRSRPVRNEWSKFFVPVAEFMKEYYPTYMEGPAYLMSQDCVGPLLRAADHSLFLRMEDVLVTGVLVAAARVRRRPVNNFLYSWRLQRLQPGKYDALRRVPHPCIVQRYVGIHSLLPRELYDAMWRNSKRCCRC